MDTFHALLGTIKNDCAWECIPTDKIAALAQMWVVTPFTFRRKT